MRIAHRGGPASGVMGGCDGCSGRWWLLGRVVGGSDVATGMAVVVSVRCHPVVVVAVVVVVVPPSP